MADCVLGISTADFVGQRPGTIGDRFITKVTLNNAAIKAFPTTAHVELVTSADASHLLIPTFGVVIADFAAGAYTNLDAAAFISIETHIGNGYGLAYVQDDAGAPVPTTNFSTMFGTAQKSAVVLPIFTVSQVDSEGETLGLTQLYSDFHGNIVASCNNGGSGNFTGGNALNTLTFYLAYTSITL